MTAHRIASRLPVATAVALVAVALAGCRFGPIGPPDSLKDWSATPLPPDPAIAANAIGENGACRMDENPADQIVPAAPQILLQDRRTAHIAAFLVSSPDHFGSCLIDGSGGSAGAGFGPPLEAMDGKLTVDDNGSGTVADGAARHLGGRVAIAGAHVMVHLTDGSAVTASTAGGFWLAWWPASNAATKVVAVGADGAELATLEVETP